MSRFVYLIVSHTNPGQVLRLAAAIGKASPGSQVAIHHDASKSHMELPTPGQAHLIPNPISIEWGTFSLVEMLLHSLRWIEANLDFDWLIVISGQDYPTQPLADFESRLASSGYDAFIRYFPVDDPGHWPKGLGFRRYYFRYISLPRFSRYYLLPAILKHFLGLVKVWFNDSQSLFHIQTCPRRIPTKLGIRRIDTPFNERFVCYGGWDWFNMNRRSVNAILRAVERNPKIVEYYRRTFIPSESFVHTLLVNNDAIKVFSDACRFVNWGEKKHSASPETIRCKDLQTVLESRQPFARKFDAAVDSTVLDRLDSYLASEVTPGKL